MRPVLVLLFVLAACKEPPPPAPLEGPFVVLKLDGRVLAAVPITHRISLTELVPTVPPWILVEAAAADGRYLELAEPAKTYPGGEIRLDREQGHITIGMFNPPVANAPPAVVALAAQPAATLSDVTEIDVLTRPRPQPAAVGIEVVIAGQPAHVLESGDLDALEEARPRPRIRGWALRDVIDLAAPGVAYGRVQVISAGAQQTFSRDELASATVSVLLKMNQRAQYVLQVWDASALDRPRLQLREVTRLVLEPAI